MSGTLCSTFSWDMFSVNSPSSSKRNRIPRFIKAMVRLWLERLLLSKYLRWSDCIERIALTTKTRREAMIVYNVRILILPIYSTLAQKEDPEKRPKTFIQAMSSKTETFRTNGNWDSTSLVAWNNPQVFDRHHWSCSMFVTMSPGYPPSSPMPRCSPGLELLPSCNRHIVE